MTDRIIAKGFESSIVESWSGWDDVDVMSIQFYDAKLSVDVGPYKKGEQVNTIAFLLDECFIVIYDENGEETHKQQIRLDLV